MRLKITMKIIMFSIFYLLAATIYAAPEGPTNNSTHKRDATYPRSGIQVKDGLVYMEVKEADIVLVLKELARQSRINITVDQGVRGKITADMKGLPLEEALRRLCKNSALVFEYLPEKKAFRIIRAGAYSGKAEGTKRGLKGNETGTADTKSRKAPGKAGKRASQKPEKMYDSKGRLLYKPGEILVKFKKGISEERIETLHKSLGSEVIGRIDRLRLQRVKLRNGLPEQVAIQRYYDSGIVELAERHALRYPDVIPNDIYFQQERQWGLTKIDAPKAWNITQGSPQIIIAVIDSGVDYLHPDLADNIWINPAELNGSEGQDDDNNGYVDDIYGWDFAGNDELDPSDEDNDPMDVDGHGTHVAGIIAARGNNGLGIAGISWNAKVMPLKVQADNSNSMDDWALIEALSYARDKGARVVNCSFGGEAFEESEYEIFASLKNAGILAVCAAGNGSSNTDEEPNYPSSYDLDNIISVAASDRDDRLASFSNYGANTVDVMAPGVDIESTLPAGTYTEAKVSVATDSGTIEYAAIGMALAGVTGEDGITAQVQLCGLGYPQDFPPGASGYIALIERGEIYFSEKTINAQNAGAIAAIIYNNEPGNFEGTLGSPGDWIPVVSVSKADGEDLKAMEAPLVTLVNKPVVDSSSFGTRSGTSMAAPHVAGIAGLILSKYPGLNYLEVKSAILGAVDKIPSMEGKILSGGRVNALCALCSIDPLPGDISCDHQIGLDDAILALQALSGLVPEIDCYSCISAALDLNGDEKVGLEEAIYVLQKVGSLR